MLALCPIHTVLKMYRKLVISWHVINPQVGHIGSTERKKMPLNRTELVNLADYRCLKWSIIVMFWALLIGQTRKKHLECYRLSEVITNQGEEYKT